MEIVADRPVYRRYHKDAHESYGQCVPGEISSELRDALGLEDKELPSFTYMMRLAGYPPGWLQEAVVSHSGISMFDGQGKGKFSLLLFFIQVGFFLFLIK